MTVGIKVFREESESIYLTHTGGMKAIILTLT
jgi:hypothetical protein